MSRMNRQGFTLIELMVVIVIIGVLASLAIPRFTEASSKAKAAEAPRVLASFESAYLAMVAEGVIKKDNLIFNAPDSKWFTYATNVENNGGEDDNCEGTVKNAIGSSIKEGAILGTVYAGDNFGHYYDGNAEGGKKLASYVPNFDASEGPQLAKAAALEAAQKACSDNGGTWTNGACEQENP